VVARLIRNHRRNCVPNLVVAVGHPAGGANMAPAGGRCVDGVLPGSDHVSFQRFIVKG